MSAKIYMIYENIKMKKKTTENGGKRVLVLVNSTKSRGADIAFAIDSMLATVAIAVTLPHLGEFDIGGINGGQFIVMLLGGFIGVIMMRFAAQWFVKY